MKVRAPLAFRLLCVVALGIGVAIGVLQRAAVARAAAEHQALANDRDEAERLTTENATLPQLRATNEEVKGLRKRQRELARLRNEVVQWRAQAAEAARLRAENRQLASLQGSGASSGQANLLPANFISRADMADVGLGSPEATVQTYFYAMFQGDVKRVLQCQANQAEMTPEQVEDQAASLRRQFANFPGFLIAEQNVISPDEDQIGVQASVGGVIFPIHLIRNGNEWNVK